MKKIEKGEVKAKFPDLSNWEHQLIEFYSLCINENGLNISFLEIVFEKNKIKSDSLFYETCIILSKLFHKMRA